MKQMINLSLVALTMFALAAGASWTWDRMSATDEPATETNAHATGKSPHDAEESADSHRPSPLHPAPVEEPPARVAVQSTYAPGVEETVKLASSLRDRAALVREREDQLATRQRQLELVMEDIRSERAAIEGLRADLDAAIKAGEERHAKVQRQHTELEIKQQTIDGRVTEMTGNERDNLKKMASVYDNMAAESAAKIIQHMADSGTMDTAVKLLAVMKERQAAKVLAEMSDPSLAAQLSERLKDLKHPPTAAKQ